MEVNGTESVPLRRLCLQCRVLTGWSRSSSVSCLWLLRKGSDPLLLRKITSRGLYSFYTRRILNASFFVLSSDFR
ncbi:uncharacterized protein BDCG_17207 [Blastomyces dermatitidis ER-3]|uniref:Uncharacterized protein n=1 Tax=Ajellomyces dermatitidis (strain ER-3 / ATCC MYA-2586) TaxID=559297 RepID=A0ABP2F1U4_AJEDR|nr:uncharacterized protein BDCG_17207 [Blastomyces dermatitidis ER-3]EEQ90708.2 hypothetical protein BDCG_17207 [Blastomyces dermatitidis ER-3]